MWTLIKNIFTLFKLNKLIKNLTLDEITYIKESLSRLTQLHSACFEKLFTDHELNTQFINSSDRYLFQFELILNEKLVVVCHIIKCNTMRTFYVFPNGNTMERNIISC